MEGHGEIWTGTRLVTEYQVQEGQVSEYSKTSKSIRRRR